MRRHARGKRNMLDKSCLPQYQVLLLLGVTSIFSVLLLSPSSLPLWWVRNTKRCEPFQLAVIEDHQDALRYWMKALTDRKLYPEDGIITLVHVDAHADCSGPSDSIARWLFHNSNGNYTLASPLLDRVANDEFILAAVLLGIPLRVVNIQPSWNMYQQYAASNGRYATPAAIKITLGEQTNQPYWNHGKRRQLCLCHEVKLVAGDEKKPSTTTCSDLSDAGKDLDVENCNIFGSFDLILVTDLDILLSEAEALKSMLQGTGVSGRSGGVILDVDLNYFGKVEKVQPMKNFANKLAHAIVELHRGCKWLIPMQPETREILEMDKFIRMAARFFRDRGTSHSNYRGATNNHGSNTAIEPFSLLSLLSQHGDLSVLHKVWLAKEMSDTFMCPHVLRELSLTSLVEVLASGSQAELNAVDRYGVCIRENTGDANSNDLRIEACFERGTVMEKEQESTRTRLGRTDPTFDLQVRHTSVSVVKRRIHDFDLLVKKLVSAGMHTRVGTLCRSTRSGYLFLERWQQIESGVIDVMSKHLSYIDVDGDVCKTETIWDQRLWGGQGGWLNRSNTAQGQDA